MNGVEPQDLSNGNVPYSRWIQRLKADNMQNRDSVICIDATDASRFGAVGGGKTCSEIQLLLSLNPRGHTSHPKATISQNLVVIDDWDHYKHLLEKKVFYLPIGVDEAEHFWYSRLHARKGQIDRILTYMSNRKERKFTLGTLPRIWDMDVFMRTTRITWRLKIIRRGRAQLFVRNSPEKWNQKKDLWGEMVTEFNDIPDLPEYLWNEYYKCLESYKAQRKEDGTYIKTINRAAVLV